MRSARKFARDLAAAQEKARAKDRAEYARARSRAVHAASQILRARHRSEYQALLDDALREEGLG